MKLLLLAVIVALAAADKPPVNVLVDERVSPDGGSYTVDLQLDNGVSISESGSPGSLGQTNVEGSYSFIDENGEEKTVHYTAGENGFIATGSHLPQEPPAPPHVADLIKMAEQQKKDGIEFN